MVSGVVNKLLVFGVIMFFMVVIGFIYVNFIFMWGGVIFGLVVVIVVFFKFEWFIFLVFLYVGLEGFFVGFVLMVYVNVFFFGIIF